jgi:hypothetical protein
MNLVKYNLLNYIPELIDFIGEEKFPWDDVEKKFNRKINQRVSKKNGDSIVIEASIFDQIISIKKGDSDYIGMIDFYNKLFYQLKLLLNQEEKKLILRTIKNLLVSFDSKYLNYLGELSALYQLKRTNNFILLEVEKNLPNGKSIDFDMTIQDPKMRVLIEVINIQINPKKVENNANSIRRFINGRLEKKITDKKKNLIDNWNIHLVPVIWGGNEQLEIYHEYFKTNSPDLPLSYVPLAFLTYYDQNGNYFPKFGSISTLFDS